MTVGRTSVYERMLGSSTDAFLRRMAINFAIVGFLLHLLCCVLYDFKIIESDDLKSLFDSYLDALYTPFSIILAYEVYELIRAIPESFSNSIGKQFEVVTLLVVRDIFKNLADLGGADNITIDTDVAFIAVEAVAFVILFGTALYFRAQTSDFKVLRQEEASIQAFVQSNDCLVLNGAHQLIPDRHSHVDDRSLANTGAEPIDLPGFDGHGCAGRNRG